MSGGAAFAVPLQRGADEKQRCERSEHQSGVSRGAGGH